MVEYSADNIQLADTHREGLERFGYLGRDEFGRVYVDTCKTNEEHLQNRHGCRKYIEDLFPAEWVGRYVLVSMSLVIVEHKRQKNER
jgi:hypothetical protein